jgi:uncharacterized protein YprB with RNaseH-like and TPR domain
LSADRAVTDVRIENSYIPVRGVGEKTERGLWAAGATHWAGFDPELVGPTTAERIRSFIDDAREHLDAGRAHEVAASFPAGEIWRCYENLRDEAAFFDIETTGLSQRHDDVTCVTVHRDGDTTTLVRGDDLSRERLRRSLDAPLVVTYNGATFDVPFLEKSFDLDLDVPHLDLRYPCRRLELTGGLTGVERTLGIERERPDISGRDAVRLWHEHQRGVDGALETLVSYNREDTVNMIAVADAVTDRLHEETFPE